MRRFFPFQGHTDPPPAPCPLNLDQDQDTKTPTTPPQSTCEAIPCSISVTDNNNMCLQIAIRTSSHEQYTAQIKRELSEIKFNLAIMKLLFEDLERTIPANRRSYQHHSEYVRRNSNSIIRRTGLI